MTTSGRMSPRLAAPFVGHTSPVETDCEIAVIVPFYRGAVFVSDLVARLQAVLDPISPKYQIVLVDDRSPDNDWAEICAACADDERVVGIRLSRNFGQHAAISAGIAYSEARWYVVMDCDLQDPPEAIAALYAEAVNGTADVVIAERSTSGLGAHRNLGSAMFNGLLRWASGLPVSNKVGNFRLFSHKVADAYRAFPEQLRLFPAIMSQSGFRVSHVTIARAERAVGKSSYGFLKLVRLALETIIAYSEKPLWWMVGAGLVICGLSFLFGLSVVLNAVIGGTTVPGYASLASIMTFLGGAQIFLISFVGIYVGRALAEAKRRPIFIVDELVRH
ncbi:glycosyltransferase family 2 protein [Maricaulis sp. CAU 1757]